MWVDEFFRRLRFFKRCKRFDRDLLEEMDFHVSMKTRDFIQQGMLPEQARYAALRKFGNECVLTEASREAWGWAWFENFVQDARYAVRALRKHWAFTLAALLTLALGIGANTAMFSVVYAVLIEPLPYPHADRLMFLAAKSPAGAAISFSYPEVLDWQAQTRAFDTIAAYQSFGFTVTGSSETQRFPGRTVSASFFSTLGITPGLGRDFIPQDDRPG